MTWHTEDSGETPAALIVGGGRHAAEVIDALLAAGQRVHGCLDARLAAGSEVYPGVRVVGSDRDLRAMIADGFRRVYLGVGGLANLAARIRLFEQLVEFGCAPPVLIHPGAHVSPSARIGEGTTILARASVGPLSVVGRNSVLTQGSIVTHHCRIGDHVVIAPGAALAAGVEVGDESTIGMGVTVFADVRVGRRCVLVNGVAAMQNVPDDSILKHAGAPAVIRPREGSLTA